MVTPSKELFCEVLSLPLENDVEIILNGNKLILKKNECNIFNINILEFTFKIKHWAYSNGFTIESMKNVFGHSKVYNNKLTEIFRCGTEPEAIIKAGEWILKS